MESAILIKEVTRDIDTFFRSKMITGSLGRLARSVLFKDNYNYLLFAGL